MTVIDGVRGPNRPASVAQSRRSDGTGWVAPALIDGEAAAIPQTASLSGLDSLLVLQERQGDATADRRARRHGHSLLAGLAAVQRGLLHPDGVSPADLTQLASLCDSLPFASDPGLRSVLQSIALRARIELARAA